MRTIFSKWLANFTSPWLQIKYALARRDAALGHACWVNAQPARCPASAGMPRKHRTRSFFEQVHSLRWNDNRAVALGHEFTQHGAGAKRNTPKFPAGPGLGPASRRSPCRAKMGARQSRAEKAASAINSAVAGNSVDVIDKLTEVHMLGGYCRSLFFFLPSPARSDALV